MSKRNDDGFDAEIILKGSPSFIRSLKKAISEDRKDNGKISTSVKREGDNLYIAIKTKNTRLLQSVVGSYLSAVSTMEGIDKL